MKIRVLPIITRPEPSAEPFAALLIALVAAASVTAATAALLSRF